MGNTTTHVKNVCKVGQKSETCRHLLSYETGFACAKTIPQMKELMDSMVITGNIVGRGDNCAGIGDPKVLNVPIE